MATEMGAKHGSDHGANHGIKHDADHGVNHGIRQRSGHAAEHDSGNKSYRILVVDDEEALRESVKEYLELEGFLVDSAASAEEALLLDLRSYDLLLLDIMMESMSGTELARRLREDETTRDLPIIFLTAKDSDDDMVEGLRIGGDDYIPKPFSLRNVSARVSAVLRRSGRKEKTTPVKCDRVSLTCIIDGEPITLPRKEFEILALMLDNPGRIFTREELMTRIWPDNVVVTDRSIDVHITRIRGKLGAYGKHIITRSGYGYGWQQEDI